ncbi:MAG: hypothetical protein Q8Q35_03895 [Nanoarchaeota archaeon]|nr:hypothetical protein [Nanoarchaeota archaeon]
MTDGPISEIKNELQRLQTQCDELHAAINTSRQNEAAKKLKQLLDNLNKVNSRLNKEFGWLLPQEPIE